MNEGIIQWFQECIDDLRHENGMLEEALKESEAELSALKSEAQWALRWLEQRNMGPRPPHDEAERWDALRKAVGL
jgi:hypothetical protein